jgi:hypothetical protein
MKEHSIIMHRMRGGDKAAGTLRGRQRIPPDSECDPVTRALLRRKRKSDVLVVRVDEAARAAQWRKVRSCSSSGKTLSADSSSALIPAAH